MRVEKTTPNADDFRVLLWGAVIAIGLMVFMPTASRLWDTHIAERPFVSATVEVVKIEGREKPALLYDADATRPVDATWIATLWTEDEVRIFTTRGTGDYSPKEDNPKLWTWNAFFDNEIGGTIPNVPVQPFQVCLRYISQTRDTLVADESEITCSAVFYPDRAETYDGLLDNIVGE